MGVAEPLPSIVPGRPKRLALAVSAATALGGVQGAQAALEIEEIIVTATKRSESLQDVAQAVQAFSTEDIRRQRFVGIDDYAKKLPALSFANREPGGLSVVFRGVSVSGLAFGENASSSVYLDEQPITSSGRNPNPRLIDIERLEALSGPQGTLFGDSSQSGALRIITNKPDAGEMDGWVEGTASGFEEGDVGGDLSGMVNLPLVKDKLALRLVGFAAHEAGFIDNVEHKSPGRTYTNADIAENNVNSADAYGGRAALRWHINDEWTADATGVFEHREADGFSDVDVELNDLDQRRFEHDSLEDEWYQMALTLEGPVLGFDSTIAVSYFDRDFRYEADATDYEFSLQRNSCGPRYPGTCDNNSPDFYSDFYDFGGDPRGQAANHDQEDRWSIEARLVTPGDSTSRWSGVAGLFYNKSSGKTLFQSRARNFGDTDFFDYLNYLAYLGNGSYKDPTNTWWMGGYDTELEQSAVFGEVTYAITERISITGGGRWYDVEDSFLLVNGALQEGWPDPNEEPIWTNVKVDSDESGDVWKLSLKYQIDDDRMVYATYSEGFRSGGGNPIRRDSKLPTSFDSDFLYNYEVGLKSTWRDGRVLFNATAYHMDWLDIQVQVEDPRPAVFALAFVNFPEASIDGIETQLQWLISDNWQVNASMAKIDAEISKTATLFPRSNYPITVVDGTPLPLAPDYKGAITLEYAPTFSLFGGEPFMQLDYSYQGESYNSIGSEAIIAENPPARHDNYATLDFSMGVETEGWSAILFVDNLTDERGEQFFNNRWGKQRLSISDPRTWGLTVRKNF